MNYSFIPTIYLRFALPKDALTLFAIHRMAKNSLTQPWIFRALGLIYERNRCSLRTCDHTLHLNNFSTHSTMVGTPSLVNLFRTTINRHAPCRSGQIVKYLCFSRCNPHPRLSQTRHLGGNPLNAKPEKRIQGGHVQPAQQRPLQTFDGRLNLFRNK